MASWPPDEAGSALRSCTVVTDPARVEDLLRFLRGMGYVAEEVDYAQIRVEPGNVQGDLALKLHLTLDVWRVVNAGAQARIVARPERLS